MVRLRCATVSQSAQTLLRIHRSWTGQRASALVLSVNTSITAPIARDSAGMERSGMEAEVVSLNRRNIARLNLLVRDMEFIIRKHANSQLY